MQFSFIFLLFWGWKAIFHPFYISLTEIRYNEREKSLEIEQKIFWDDLEVALSKEYNQKVNFLQASDQAQLERMVREYLLANNSISVNGQVLSLDYLGYEVDEDAAWFYLEAKRVPSPRTVEIKNTVLLAHFSDQQNIINFYKSNSPRSIILKKGKETGKIDP